MAWSLLWLGLAVTTHASLDHLYLNDPSQATLHIFNKNTAVTTDWSLEVPFFPKYPTRTVQVLDGNWNFGYGGSSVNLSQRISPADFEKLTPNVTYVPSAFDVKQPGILGPRGTAFYRANFSSPKGQDIQVYLSACAFYCQLYFDGTYVGDHKAGGYQPFWFHITQKMMDTSTENHELFIVSDNQYNKETAPTYTGGDFYHFGGLNRNVLVHTLPSSSSTKNYLLRVEATPKDMSAMNIDVNVTFGAVFSTDTTASLEFEFNGDANSNSTYALNMKASQQWALIPSVAVPSAKLWSFDAPNLHTLTVRLR